MWIVQRPEVDESPLVDCGYQQDQAAYQRERGDRETGFEVESIQKALDTHICRQQALLDCKRLRKNRKKDRLVTAQERERPEINVCPSKATPRTDTPAHATPQAHT